MNTINFNFFETYKKLEKICNEVYSSTNGITQYINEMKSVPSSIYQYIPNWKSDLSTLHTLRHIRNQYGTNRSSFTITAKNNFRKVQISNNKDGGASRTY